ncbi:MAG: hypothetical protein WHS38_01755 [Thermodesulforhabdaceae bacterium]
MNRKVILKIIILVILLIFAFPTFNFCFAEEVPFTLEDRDRLIKLETKVEEGFKAVNQRMDTLEKRIDDLDKRIDALDKRIDGLDKRIDGLDKRMDGLQGLMYVIISGIFILIGFVIWDRRTALAPAIRKNKELEEREEKIERALKEIAKKDPTVAEVLRDAGLL